MSTSVRIRVRHALEGDDTRLGRLVPGFLYGAIAASAVVITIQSLPDLDVPLRLTLIWAEVALLTVFALEYLARLWSAENPLRYALSFWGIIDFLAILPALLFVAPDTQVLRTLRLLRIFRLLKLLRLHAALDRLEQAIEDSRDEMLLFSLLALIVLFLAAVGIYQFERHAQPEHFGSIPQSLWWALATLTTVGYGDVYPVTVGGKAFTALTLLIGLGIVAIPAGIVTSALLTRPEPEKNDPNTTERETP